MTLPFKCKRMLVKIGTDVVGVVEGMGIEFIKEGGSEPHYGSETHKHAIGTRHGTFTIRRWMFVDTKKKLLFNMYNDETEFNLEFGISDMDPTLPDFVSGGGMKIVLSDCVGYRWRPITGATNDIIAEELVGEFIDWVDTEFTD